MPRLDYPISLLLIELSKHSQVPPASAKDLTEKVNQLNAINRAVCILVNEKMKDEKENLKNIMKIEKL